MPDFGAPIKPKTQAPAATCGAWGGGTLIAP
jgi:hypothetical protein